MNRSKKFIGVGIVLAALCVLLVSGCSEETSDQKQSAQQEIVVAQGRNEVGQPNIKNFRELKILKDIYELRDQDGLVTYSYVENEYPHAVPGVTALGGKFTYLGATIGYGIPYAAQYSNPEQIQWTTSGGTPYTLPQSEPNGIFTPSTAEGTWLLMLNPKTNKAEPQYIEPRVATFTYKLPSD